MSQQAPATATNQPTERAERQMTKAEVAHRLNCSLKTVSNWMRRGILPYYKPGHKVWFRWSEIEAHWKGNYLRSRRQNWGQAHVPIKSFERVSAG